RILVLWSYVPMDRLIEGGIGRPKFGSLLREDVNSGDAGLRSLPLEDRVSYYSGGKMRKHYERRQFNGRFVSAHGIAAEYFLIIFSLHRRGSTRKPWMLSTKTIKKV
nr:hypothetical protein [Tanacetum cinerariifolium]GFA54469.1 hypothetical protein [Tanacetum cinerariifolium]